MSNTPSTEYDSSFPLPLSSWVYHHKLLQMAWIVQLGFELDLYQPDELAGMYLFVSIFTEELGNILTTILVT
jgi:hypothetical protein